MQRKDVKLNAKSPVPALPQAPSLRELAAHLQLSPTTLSLVLNESPAGSSIPKETRDRIFAAAKEFNYRPNFVARSLRAQRSFTIGVFVPEISDGYSAMVLSGIEDYLLKEGYFYLVASHRHDQRMLDDYQRLLCERCVEGIVAVDTPCPKDLSLPMVAISRHDDFKGVTNVTLNHRKAASLALEYLMELGHRDIAFIKGQSFSSDTEVRWKAIRDEARRLGLPIQPALVAQLEGNSPSPELGYIAAHKLLGARKQFTALFAFNDVSAIGAMRALNEAGRDVPRDVSVIGFDDVYSAAFQNPPLTTIRQPLRQMGSAAAETLLKRIVSGPNAPYPTQVVVEPELVVRQSAGPAASRKIDS